ncbi:hypothetical protein AALO_G00114610 [Alosa alosa]|uniref:Sec39 domain-containing protein n=1 Tax=Alosa alosa TaxID=278164 RepID=A0AAV6GU13_9TELE|nr:hypothetical protein AALO_G00114610 [Alosa alosa]
MQQNVYTCLKPESCQEVFTESLLCSGRQETVSLAGQMMHCSALAEDTPVSVSLRLRAAGRVAYGRSVELVLAAAREYFNSSATLRDPCMNLARSCLLLITDCPSVVAEELDLISALSRLEDFNVKVLPLQVRLREDRLSLIRECVSQCPSAHRQATTLLELARLLRVAGDDEATRKGQVLTLLADQALQCQDFKASYSHCQELMTTGYSGGWDVCARLGECEGYTDLPARQKLMAFSLTHCPVASIQDLLAASSTLETQVLYQAVNYQKDPTQSEESSDGTPEEEDSEQSADLLHRTTARTMQVLTQTGETTRAVLSAVTDKQWWRDSLNYLRPLQGHGMSTGDASANHNADLERQACHPFYESLFENPYVHPSEDVYSSYDYTPCEDFAEVLLRTGKLAETRSEGQNLFPATEVLLQLASDAFPRDMTLALAYLLALPQVLDANSCFEKQPASALSLQLASYYYSLQIYSRLASCFTNAKHPLYRVDPKELIRLVTRHVGEKQDDNANWPAEVDALIGQLRAYSERLADFTQAQVLQGLGRGVDTQRFSSDAQYKKETILGLAETLDESVYHISISLAQRYSVPLWEVYMTHLEFLFTDSGLPTNEIESRCESLGLLATLKNDPEEFYAHMLKYVYPAIAGSDLSRLLLYYSLLESCDCTKYVTTAMKPDTHVKLLKKLKAVARGLDYRKLTDESSDPLCALGPVLTSQNVLSISKLLGRLPLRSAAPSSSTLASGGGGLGPSAVHGAWLRKLFWHGDVQLLRKPPQTDGEFLHAYDTCAKYLDRLVPADTVAFLDFITFSAQAANQLSVETRCEISRRALKSLQTATEKNRKKGGDDGEGPASFEPALSHLSQSVAHLETLTLDFPLSLKNSDEELVRSYSRLYDLSRSEGPKVHQLAVTMAMDGQPLGRIEQLLQVAVGTSELSVKGVMRDAVEQIILAFSGDEEVLKDYPDPLKVLEGIVAAVHIHVENGGGLVSSDNVLAWLRPFCGDDSRPVRPRIEVLKVLEHSFSLSEEDIRLLVFFRSQAVLKAGWPDRELEIKDIAWPPVTGDNMTDPERNPWVSLTSSLLTHSSPGSKVINLGDEVLAMCRSLYPTKHTLPPQCVSRVSTLLLDQALLLPALKLMAESGDEQLLSLVLDQLKAVSQVDDSKCDSELLSLLLTAGLLIGCVETAYYPRLVSHLLTNHQEGGWDVEASARELSQAGHSAQAGSLLLAYRGTHPGQLTFSSALSVIRQWL